MDRRRTKYIFVSGGVLSSVGKGIASASIGALCESMGLNVSVLKLDPYLNVDPGTMNPLQHGEVFVTDDGAETDLDLGHYERFLSARLGRANSKTTGQIYRHVFERERKGDYLGATVQVIPHVTDAIKEAIRAAGKDRDVLICEVGGTVGDIESQPFMEAIRQIRSEKSWHATMTMHVSYVPYIKSADELKTKPTQHSVKELQNIGIQPDIVVLRSENPVPRSVKDKIALFCNVAPRAVINCPDVATVYEVPLKLRQEQLDVLLQERLQLPDREPDLEPWRRVVRNFQTPTREIHIGIVGKYTGLKESYKSIHEALIHAGIAHRVRVVPRYIDSAHCAPRGGAEGPLLPEVPADSKCSEGTAPPFCRPRAGGDPGDQNARDASTNLVGAQDTSQAKSRSDPLAAVLIPGGFGERGIEGKIAAVQWARTQGVPFLGICLGMQIAAIELARHVAGIRGATSQEMDPQAAHPVIHLMDDQRAVQRKGGTMRLGSYPCALQPDSVAARAYGKQTVHERHRHRYEFNNAYREPLQQAGVRFSGLSPDGNLVEMLELPDHPFFVGCQFHPEFLSKPLAPHPLFVAFVKAALDSDLRD